MRRILLPALLLALAITAQAEQVYLTPKGKTFHHAQTCMALTRSKQVLTAERATAEAHGLKACGICFRAAKQKKAATNDWAKSQEKQ